MEPMLTIIIPIYNGDKYLVEAVNSILKQPCQDLEIIIVDDGSNDSSGTIADRFAAEYDNIRVFHIPNGGVSVARNVGIDHAAGKYIGFLDADDVLCRNAYDEEIHGALESGKYDILSFSYMKGMENLSHGCMMPANAAGLYLREDPNYTQQEQKHFCSYIYRRSLFTDIVRFPAGIRYHEDVCFLFLAVRNADSIMQFEKPWFVYRMNFSSVMHNLKTSDYVLEEIDAWNWCRGNCTRQKDISDCEGNIFSYMIEYIKISCMRGIPIDIIQKKVLQNEPFQDAMKYYGQFWLSDQTAQQYQAFLTTPRKVWMKYRMKGISHNVASRLIRTKAGNLVNQKLRYKLSLKEYLVE